MKLFLDDWIAVNVLRSVALSTNSVAASVEPVMQQQFFTLSPMAGQESFNPMEVRPQHLMAHTPTTSSMLAALQNDPFPAGSLDPSTSGFNSDAYGALSYMDTSNTQDDSNAPLHQSGLTFPDFVSGSSSSFDVGAFTPQDMGLGSGTPAASEPDHETEPIKSETPA
jgi:regulatory factor X